MPVMCGALPRYTPVQIAERVMSCAQMLDRKGHSGRYAVTLDHAGRVRVGDVHTAPEVIHVATVTYASCPDWLADELSTEWASRNEGDNPAVRVK